MPEIINNVYQETCKDGDVACHNRNLKRLLDALDNNVKSEIDNQSEGIAYGQKHIEQNIISTTNNSIAQSERNLSDRINVVYSEIRNTENNLDGLSNYITNQQSQHLDDIQNDVNEVLNAVYQVPDELRNDLDNLSGNFNEAAKELSADINNQIDMTSNILQAEISEHDRDVRLSFEYMNNIIDSETDQVTNDLNQTINSQTKHIDDELLDSEQYLARYIGSEVSELALHITAEEMANMENSWNIVDFLTGWVLDAFKLDNNQIAEIVLSLVDVSTLVGKGLQNKGQGG